MCIHKYTTHMIHIYICVYIFMFQVYAVASEDMDSLTFGSPKFVRHLMEPSARKIPVMEFDIEKVREHMSIHTQKQHDVGNGIRYRESEKMQYLCTDRNNDVSKGIRYRERKRIHQCQDSPHSERQHGGSHCSNDRNNDNFDQITTHRSPSIQFTLESIYRSPLHLHAP